MVEEKVKKRKIRRSDWQKVESFLKKELQARKDSNFRKAAERIWTEVDRQIAMEAMKKMAPSGKELPNSWKSAFELGELSKASEIITADVMRLIFPQNRTWFEAHCKAPQSFNPQTGQPVGIDDKTQHKADGLLRSLMAQQHIDFGLRARVELSVKEALHHGSFVATAEWETQNKVYDGVGLESLSAPVWIPHSMWNCYPDMSPSVIPGANIFYPGTMMIVSYMKRHKVLALKGAGYMNLEDMKIPKRKNNNKDVETEDVEILTYYGDLVIPRDDGDIYLPNSKCKTANGTIIYYEANEYPWPEVIYNGYERQDVRNPYFTSPIVKNSPIQKLATILANQFIDAVDLHTTPPIVYDGNDPYMVANGGLNLWPGAQTASKGSNKFQAVAVGEPRMALEGLQLALQKLEEGTAVNAIRSGGNESDRKTATEVSKTAQGAEVRTVDFVAKLEPGGLRPFLYMQHEMNLKHMEKYSFYCSEKELPDFISVTKDDLPKVVHFEIVGSRGLLGEEQRTQRMTAVTAFASQNPLFAGLLNAKDILIDMYEDAGVKGAEKYIKQPQKGQIPPEVQQQLQQAQQIIQGLQQELQKAQTGEKWKMAEIALKDAESKAKIAREEAETQLRQAQAAQQMLSDRQALSAEITQSAEEVRLEKQKLNQDYALRLAEIQQDFDLRMVEIRNESAQKMAEIEAKREAEKAAEAAPRTTKIRRTADGYEVDGKRKAKIRRTADGYEVNG